MATRTSRLDLRLPAAQKAVIQRAADLVGRSVSDFVLSAAEDAAADTIEQQRVIALSKQDSEVLAAALLNPPKPTTAMLKAAERYRQRVRQ